MPQPGATCFDGDAMAHLVSSDPTRAAGHLRTLANAGDNNARLVLAQMTMEGKGVARDAAEALHLYTLAANAGNALAMNQVGRCHELGAGTVIDLALAAAWYRKAGDSGLDWGMYNLANLLATGRGVTRDPAAAFALYQRAAARGHAKSMNLVGRHYEEGQEVARDRAAAVAWYRRAAHAGDFRGQASYAAILADAGNLDQAEHWLRIAIAAGTPSFHAHLANTLPGSPHPRLRAQLASLPRDTRTSNAAPKWA